MSKVDDELTRRLRRAERPVQTDDLVEGLARRRHRRRTLQRAQAGALAVAVLAATGVGFVALQRAFDQNGRDVGTALAGNGEIVFAKDGDDDRQHIYAAQPDGTGLRQLTEGDSNDADPAVSPDGTTVAFAHDLNGTGRAVIATIPIEGGGIIWQTGEHQDVTDPAWSPDGSRIAFVGYTTDTADLYVTEAGTDVAQRIPLSAEENDVMPTGAADFPAHPTWSPDGTRIAVAVATETGSFATSWDIAVLRPDASGLGWLVATDGIDERAPAWSPDGSRIAYLKPGPEGDEVWTIAPDGTEDTLVAAAVDASLTLDLDWAPDGSSLLVSDGDWIYRVDATPDGDPRENFVQLMKGLSPSWQPVPAGSEPSATPTPEPSVSPSPEPEGKDIGLGFNLCDVERLGGIDFRGDGTNGQAWTGTPTNDADRCPNQDALLAYLVAADVDGDGAADTISKTIPDCFECQPFDAADFDADGDEELVVLWSGGSTPAFMIYAITNGEIAPVLVAEPGHPEAREEPGQPLTFATGGDEGYSGWVRCENFPAAPVLVITWRDHPIEGETMEVHETRFVLLDDGMFHVVGTNDYSAPVGEPIPGVSDDPACGVDFQLLG